MDAVAVIDDANQFAAALLDVDAVRVARRQAVFEFLERWRAV